MLFYVISASVGPTYLEAVTFQGSLAVGKGRDGHSLWTVYGNLPQDSHPPVEKIEIPNSILL